MVILGTPVGSPEFVQRFLGNRLEVQSRFWDRLKQVPDLQTAWLLLLYCAVPRANHLIRAIPPSLVAEYAQAHDDGIWTTFLDLIGHAQRPAPGPAHEGAEQLPLVRDSLEGRRVDEVSRAPPSHGSTAVGAGEASEVQEQAEGGRGAASPAGLQPVRPGSCRSSSTQSSPLRAASRSSRWYMADSAFAPRLCCRRRRIGRPGPTCCRRWSSAFRSWRSKCCRS